MDGVLKRGTLVELDQSGGRPEDHLEDPGPFRAWQLD